MNVFLPVLCLLIGYLLGNFSMGMILAAKSGTDIRHEGSGNPGSTNVLRVLGARAGALTFAGDFLKAVLAVLIGRWIGGESVGWCSLAASLGVIIGHNWPFLYGFKGGKGVACSSAIVLLMFPGWGIVSALCCIAVIVLTKYVSAGSLILVFSYFLMIIVSGQPWYIILWAGIICMMCILRHKANIRRLLSGTENRLLITKH